MNGNPLLPPNIKPTPVLFPSHCPWESQTTLYRVKRSLVIRQPGMPGMPEHTSPLPAIPTNHPPKQPRIEQKAVMGFSIYDQE